MLCFVLPWTLVGRRLNSDPLNNTRCPFSVGQGRRGEGGRVRGEQGARLPRGSRRKAKVEARGGTEILHLPGQLLGAGSLCTDQEASGRYRKCSLSLMSPCLFCPHTLEGQRYLVHSTAALMISLRDPQEHKNLALASTIHTHSFSGSSFTPSPALPFHLAE